MTLVRISPDGKEVLYLYDDNIAKITRKHGDMEVSRASDVFFDNEDKKWKIKFLHTNAVLAIPFDTREEAIAHERAVLENDLRCRFV
jgi:hypothetical protein